MYTYYNRYPTQVLTNLIASINNSHLTTIQSKNQIPEQKQEQNPNRTSLIGTNFMHTQAGSDK